VAQVKAPIPDDDYLGIIAEDDSRFNPEREGGHGAPSFN
jgi:hypothetical protein